MKNKNEDSFYGRIYTPYDNKKRNLVTHCHHCQFHSKTTLADFVHLTFYPVIGPVGFCWDCYIPARDEILKMYSSERVMKEYQEDIATSVWNHYLVASRKEG